MKTYRAERRTEWDKAEAQTLTECAWSPNAAPEARVQVSYDEDGIIVRLTSDAAPTRAVNTEPNSAVWEDSCMEFFFSMNGKSYVNLEANSLGALRASFGEGRKDRAHLLHMNVPMPTVSAQVFSDSWSVEFAVPFSLFDALWGKRPAAGESLFVNFYSCGDETPKPHYAAWNPVLTETPDFHRPDFFGELILNG